MESELDAVEDILPKNVNIVEADNMVNPVKPAAMSSASQVEVEGSSESAKTSLTRVVPANVTTDSFVYRQDVVSCCKYDGLLGVVMEVAGDSDSDSSITSNSDSEDDGEGNIDDAGGDGGEGSENNYIDGGDEDDSLPNGQVRVAWTDGSETTENISDITVADRGFLHGDIVASAADPTGQLGLVVDVSITVDLLSASGEVIKQCPSKDLKRIREFTVGDYVVNGPWLGRVDDVLDNVTILFDDGSVCKVVKADPMRLQPVSKPVIDDANCPYYPGQRIRAVSSSVFKSSRWISGLWKANRLEGTVIKVQTASVVVYWIASAYFGIGTNSSTVPSEEQNPKDLTLLDCFSYANWQLGDWCLLPSSDNDDGNLNSRNIQESLEGSHNKPSDNCSVVGEERTDFCIKSCSGSSRQDLHDTDIVSKRHQPLEQSNTMVDVLDKTEPDPYDIQLPSGATSNGYDGNAASIRIVKPCESNMPEAKGITRVGGLSNSSSSVSKEMAYENWPSYRRKLRKVLFKRDKRSRRRDETFERALFIMKTVSRVDVAWQDGTREYGLESTSLIPIQTPNDHEFFPEQYVVEKASDEGTDSSEMKRVGIVRSLNAKEKTVCVRWFKHIARPEDAREFDCEEVVSAYELEEHPDYDYCYGDVVVRLSPVSDPAKTTNLGSPELSHQKQSDMTNSEVGASEKQSKNSHGEKLEDRASDDFTCLSWVGNITGLQDGDIEVMWADGMVSKVNHPHSASTHLFQFDVSFYVFFCHQVGPQAIYVVGRDDDGDSFGGGSEVSDDAASWETVDENDMNTLLNIEKVHSKRLINS